MKFEKMETVSQLAASISHEVRNPLTVVRGFLQLVHEHSDTPEDCKTYTSLAIAEADRASEIINEYLTFARPHPEVELPLDLEQEVQKCVEIIRPLANKQGITIETAFLHNHTITGDPHKFQ
ncbi:histidine kinase dimerization/phospho-acceptor domain-containing protein [Robertmurraya korlensis]|uniref:histidine kinase dimerization/phospho-acceptor domain-containing protein n=1 Tax=Robertmurraya korlensis TaxID=519977 RepID=UPI00082463C0|nr:histidine kinase dimerization/phospho-acceptor domain-containing protein [Robertmurraya korlensis]